MIGRKYIIVIVLSWLCVLGILFTMVLDPGRMTRAEEEHQRFLIETGARLYIENCTQCHGLYGQGFVGAPLNRPELQGDPNVDKDLRLELYNAIANGRPGTTVPKWQAVPDPENEDGWLWASYTAMPAWHQRNDGPLNEMHVVALVHFIMSGQWDLLMRLEQPRPNLLVDERGFTDVNATVAALPHGQGIDTETSLEGRRLFVMFCTTCHSIGGYGNTIGPDLSQVGSWAVGISEEAWKEFLRNWISNPQAVSNRAPVFWSNYAGPLLTPPPVDARTAEADGTGDASTPSFAGGAEWAIEIPDATPLPPTQMPAFGGALSDEQITILVEYLTSLR